MAAARRGDPRRGRGRRLPARAPRPRDHRRRDLVPPGRPVAGALAARADAAAVADRRRGRRDRRGLPRLGGQRGRGGLPGRRAPRRARLPPGAVPVRGDQPAMPRRRSERLGLAGADRRGDPRVGARGRPRHPAVGRGRRGGRAHARRAVRAAAARERARRLRQPHRGRAHDVRARHGDRRAAAAAARSRRSARSSTARCSSRRRSGRATRSRRRSPPAPTSSAWRGR